MPCEIVRETVPCVVQPIVESLAPGTWFVDKSGDLCVKLETVVDAEGDETNCLVIRPREAFRYRSSETDGPIRVVKPKITVPAA